MINYKKSLLSVAAATAITATSLAADYLPLTSASNDYRWVSYGVSGLKSDGAIASAPGVFTIADTVKTALTDPTADEIEVSGMDAAGSGDLVQLKAITVDDVEIRIDTTNPDSSDIEYLETDPVRTVYITSSVSGAPQFAVSYKAALEGKTIEYSIGGGAAYEAVLNYENVYASPAVGTAIDGIDAVPGNDLKSLTETDSVVDYDFSNNPPLATEWTAADHRDAIGAAELRVYGYNALEKKWEIYDSRNTAGSNDFTDLVAAKAYWSRIDIDGAHASSAEVESGLIMGTPQLTTANYTNAGLAEGWNFIAFDGVESELRNSTVGMLLTTSTTAGGTFTITDSSGNHTVTITNIAAPDASDVVAKNINNAVAQAKLLGTMPNTFYLRAYPTAAAGQVALIANKKFIVKDGAGDELDGATTLTGAALLDPVTLVDTLNGADVENVNGVMTKYGEFAMVVEPLYGAGTAQDVMNNDAEGLTARVQVNSTSGTERLDYAANVTNANISANVYGASADLIPTEIDLDIDGAPQHILLASTSPFELRDHTFTRVYDYNDQGTDSTLAALGGDTAGTATIPQTGEANTVTAITGVGGLTNVTAAQDTASNIVFLSSGNSNAKYYLAETGGDQIQVATSSDDLARGAVKNVFSLGYLSKISTRNDVVVTLVATSLADDATDTLAFGFTDTFGTAHTGTLTTPNTTGLVADNATDNTTYINAIVTQLNTDLAAAGLTATATASINNADITACTITISGPDIADANMDFTDNAGAQTEVDVAGVPDLGYIASYSGDLTSDLKYNYIATPDYVLDGPHYVMRDNNMTLNALVAGTTDLSTGTVTWESIDLTRKPSEWLDSQDYDLFDTQANAGYWAYLTTDNSPNPLSITNVALSNEYVHHFDYEIATSTSSTTNEFTGNLEVNIAGLNAYDNYVSARVTATIGGETIEMTQDALDATKFTGSVNTRDARGINHDTNYDIIFKVADGLGNNLTQTVSGTFDNVKPNTPDVLVSNGEINIDANAADTDVAGFYVFGGTPIEGTPATQIGDSIGYLNAPGTVGVVCETLTASVFDGTEGGLTVISVDGEGTLGLGNASDATTIPFMPILLDRVLITATNSGGVWESTGTYEDFNASCTNTGTVTVDQVDTGVTLSSLSDDQTVQVAFESQGADASNEVPVTVYVSDGAATPTIAALTYPASYVGTDVFFELNGQVYGYQLETEAALQLLNNSSANAIDLSPINNNPKTGIEL